jgi:hypothetical protein
MRAASAAQSAASSLDDAERVDPDVGKPQEPGEEHGI